MDPQTEPAWLTTEFWLTVIPTILFLIKALTGHDTSGIDVTSIATIAVGIMTGAYAISRALTKRGQLMARAMVTNQRLAIEADAEAQSNARRHELSLRADRTAQQFEERLSVLEAKKTTTPRKSAPRSRR